MLKERDRKVLSYIEDYKSISLNQITNIFFNGSYETARRRMKQLEEMGLVKSIRNNLLNNKVYYIEKISTDHNLLITEFLSIIKSHGGEIEEFKIQPQYMNGKIRPDAKIIFSYNNLVYFNLLEVDLTHYTSNSKMQKYESLYKTGEVQSDNYGAVPRIVIARPTKGIRYNSRNFRVLYTDLYYNNFLDILV